MAVAQDMMVEPYTKATGTTYTTNQNDVVIGCTNSGARTISTTAADQIAGRQLVIKDENGNAGTNNITFDPAGAVTIDGAATKAISTNYGSLKVYCDGTNWFSM